MPSARPHLPAVTDELTALALSRIRRFADVAVAVAVAATLVLVAALFITQTREQAINDLARNGARSPGHVHGTGSVGAFGFGARWVEVSHMDQDQQTVTRVWVDSNTRYVKGAPVVLLIDRDADVVTIAGERNESPILAAVTSFAASTAALGLTAAGFIRWRHHRLRVHLSRHGWVKRRFKVIRDGRDIVVVVDALDGNGPVVPLTLQRTSSPEGRAEYASLIGGEGGTLRSCGMLAEGAVVLQLPGSRSLAWANLRPLPQRPHGQDHAAR